MLKKVGGRSTKTPQHYCCVLGAKQFSRCGLISFFFSPGGKEAFLSGRGGSHIMSPKYIRRIFFSSAVAISITHIRLDHRYRVSSCIRVEESTTHGPERWGRLWAKIRSLVCLSVLPLADVVPGGAGHSSCFELFGFDVMVDSRLSR